jgi:hypothetical protein
MTQPVIQKSNENSRMSMLAKLYIQIASFWPLTCADCGLGTRGPGPIIAASYLHFAQLQRKSTSKKEKHGKNIVSVMESVLLILFC